MLAIQQAKAKRSSFLPPGLGLQRKCACGAHTPGGGACASCADKDSGLQAKLAVGPGNDPLEQEADRVAEQVLAMPGGSRVARSPPRIQRFTTSRSEHTAETAPASVDRVLRGSGRPLDSATRADMEHRFQHDFSQVRVHTDAAAAESAGDVGARAYTVGRDIVFAAGHFAPRTGEGRRLVAHELTHVVQQAGGSGEVQASRPNSAGLLQRAPAKKGKGGGKKGGGKGKAPAKPKIPQICGRNSRKVADNWITKVNLDVGANTLTIEWADPAKAPAGSAGSHAISPGAGKCCVDCNDDATSQASGSLCTPKGGTWKVNGVGCALGGHPSAKNPTRFQRSGIAIHSGNTSSPPQSHGCSRTSVGISELIHDNVVVGKTEIASGGTWAGTTCYKAEASKSLVPRSSVCDGFKLKKPPEKKKTPKKAAPKKAVPKKAVPTATPGTGATPPKTAVDPLPMPDEKEGTAMPVAFDVEELDGAPEMLADGPGPGNSGAPEGSLPPAEELPEEDTAPAEDPVPKTATLV